VADHCKKPLDEYVAKHLPKVKVIHLSQRDGLIRARLAGAKVASGQVLIFLDSHTEANVNWLPPLLGTCIILSPPASLVKFLQRHAYLITCYDM
jgi:glycosyltransferase involved in cell wall biosynthesis